MTTNRDQTATERFDKHSSGNIDCINKAKDGEPMWIILGRDPVYEETVEFWAASRERAIAEGRIEDTPHEREHIATARRYADAGWRRKGAKALQEVTLRLQERAANGE